MNRVAEMTRAALATALLLVPSGALAQLPERVPPVELGDATARARLSLIAQLMLSAQGGENTDLEVTPRLRRVRPIVHARLFDELLAFRLHVEASPEAPELIDAWAELNLDEELAIRGGQLKIPFTDYWQRPLTEMAVDWPLTSRWFGGERQLGAMAHGVRADGLRYALGVFAGQNRRGAFARGLTQLYGAPVSNPSLLTQPLAPEFHAEFVGRIAHHSPGARAFTASGVPDETLQHAVALSFAWDTEPVRGRDFALRLAPEALFRFAGVSLGLIAYAGFVPIVSGGRADVSLGAFGGLVELDWRAHRHLQLTLRYARVGITDALQRDAAATLTGEHELTFVVQVPILGRGLIVQADAGWLRAETTEASKDDIRVRAQLQIAF